MHRLTIHLSPYSRRVLYFDRSSDARKWRESLEKATSLRKFSDFYDLENALGVGSFGKVYTARCKRSGGILAVKVMAK